MSASTGMPRYQSHKQVWALEIDVVDGLTVFFCDPRYVSIDCAAEMFTRYVPTSGDFYVVYDDGYKSFSPAKAFKDEYSLIESNRGDPKP
jgi:hypothetical protein